MPVFTYRLKLVQASGGAPDIRAADARERSGGANAGTSSLRTELSVPELGLGISMSEDGDEPSARIGATQRDPTPRSQISYNH